MPGIGKCRTGEAYPTVAALVSTGIQRRAARWLGTMVLGSVMVTDEVNNSLELRAGGHSPTKTLSAVSVPSTDTSGRTAIPPVRVYAAEAIVEDIAVVDERSLLVKVWCGLGSAWEWLFGLASVIAGLAFLASLPIVQFLSLGYLLEVSGRISRTGRISEGFIGVRQAGRMGSLVLGTWLMLLPLTFVSGMWRSAYLIDPRSGVTANWRVGLLFLTTIMIAHILMAWFCGGRLRHFFWPFLAPLFFAMWGWRLLISSKLLRPIVRPIVGTISKRLLRDLTTVPPLTTWFPPAILWAAFRRGGMYRTARDNVWDYVVGMRIPYFFWLGVRGFAGAIVWLFVPIMFIIVTTNLNLDDQQAANGLSFLAGLVGTALLAIVLLYLPFMQAHFAAENRFVAMFEWSEVRRQFRRAPIAFWFALLITLAFALPLYLLKIETVPREVLWLPSLIFVVFILPARMLTGWALARARLRKQPRFFLFRWLARFGALPVVAIYVFFSFLMQYLSARGSYSLFEQHAFLTPVPFIGL